MWLWMGIIGAAAAFLALGMYLWVRKAPPRAGKAKPETSSRATSESLGEDASKAEMSELERSKLVIHALLQSLSDGLTTLLDDTSTYNDSLERHKNAVKKAMTLAGLKELERVLLSELEQIQATTVEYRRELDQAKEEIHQQREQLEQLQADASLDFLTKIPNRRTFDERLKEEVSRAQRYGSTFSLMVVDVDNFKNINDLYGHQAGDSVLEALAALGRACLRTSDVFGRIGGEEFALLLPETLPEQGMAVAERLRMAVERMQIDSDQATLGITVSIGVASSVEGAPGFDRVLAEADRALYRAKCEGRNRVLAEPTSVDSKPDFIENPSSNSIAEKQAGYAVLD